MSPGGRNWRCRPCSHAVNAKSEFPPNTSLFKFSQRVDSSLLREEAGQKAMLPNCRFAPCSMFTPAMQCNRPTRVSHLLPPSLSSPLLSSARLNAGRASVCLSAFLLSLLPSFFLSVSLSPAKSRPRNNFTIRNSQSGTELNEGRKEEKPIDDRAKSIDRKNNEDLCFLRSLLSFRRINPFFLLLCLRLSGGHRFHVLL